MGAELMHRRLSFVVRFAKQSFEGALCKVESHPNEITTCEHESLAQSLVKLEIHSVGCQ